MFSLVYNHLKLRILANGTFISEKIFSEYDLEEGALLLHMRELLTKASSQKQLTSQVWPSNCSVIHFFSTAYSMQDCLGRREAGAYSNIVR